MKLNLTKKEAKVLKTTLEIQIEAIHKYQQIGRYTNMPKAYKKTFNRILSILRKLECLN